MGCDLALSACQSLSSASTKPIYFRAVINNGKYITVLGTYKAISVPSIHPNTLLPIHKGPAIYTWIARSGRRHFRSSHPYFMRLAYQFVASICNNAGIPWPPPQGVHRITC